MPSTTTPRAVAAALAEAMNAHDIDAFVALFAGFPRGPGGHGSRRRLCLE
jgi:hypothetical protein